MSRARRGATSISGILVVDKPAGMTSHDVISHVRRATGERRIGHAGTLDPAATGVLVVLIGPATRLASHLTAAAKGYVARIVFGTATDTDDADGTPVRVVDVPSELAEESSASAAVEALVGEHTQTPPDYSAVKRGGVKAYEAARAGRPLELKPRTVHVTHAGLLGIDSGPPLSWDVALEVSKGTYIRAVARDLGDAHGTAAHLGALRRTSSGMLGLSDAHVLDEIDAAAHDISHLFVDPVRALDLPVVSIDEPTAGRVASGGALSGIAQVGERVAVVDGSSLLGIYDWDAGEDAYRALVVLPGGVARCT